MTRLSIVLTALPLLIGCTRPDGERHSAPPPGSSGTAQLRILLVAPERSFVAAFPGLSHRPPEDLGITDTSLGPAHKFVYHEEETGTSFDVTVLEYPDEANGDAIARFLAAARSDALALPHAHIVEARPTRIRKHNVEHADDGAVDGDFIALDVDGLHVFRTSCAFRNRAYILEVSGPHATRELNDMFTEAFRVGP